jgi:hypothetical protein
MSKQKHWGVNAVTRGGFGEHPRDRGTTRGASPVSFETQLDLLPGERLQVLTEKVCDICGMRYHRDRCPLSDNMMHLAFARFYERKL